MKIERIEDGFWRVHDKRGKTLAWITSQRDGSLNLSQKGTAVSKHDFVSIGDELNRRFKSVDASDLP